MKSPFTGKDMEMEDGVAVKCLMISCLAICYLVEIAGNV